MWINITTQKHFNSFKTEAVIIWKPASKSNLQSKSMDWFLYDNDLRHERVNKIRSNFSYAYHTFLCLKKQVFLLDSFTIHG